MSLLTHWGRVTHICVSRQTIIGSDNGSAPGRRQAIIWTNAGILLVGLLRTNFSEIVIKIHTFSFKKMHLKISSGKCCPSCLGLNVLNSHLQCYVGTAQDASPHYVGFLRPHPLVWLTRGLSTGDYQPNLIQRITRVLIVVVKIYQYLNCAVWWAQHNITLMA